IAWSAGRGWVNRPSSARRSPIARDIGVPCVERRAHRRDRSWTKGLGMRPVRFVALSEDGQAMVLADEVGRLLTLPLDDRVSSLMRSDRPSRESTLDGDTPASLAPRDIQARIRSGESADDVARIAGVPVDRVLRYAGPVLQERAMLAQPARRTRLKTSEKGATLAEVVDARLSQHGVDMEKVSWDAYRRDDGTWRV